MTCKSINPNQIPAYIVERDPFLLFGEPSEQKKWGQAVISIIEGFSLKYERAVLSGQDLQGLFYDTVKEAAKGRGEIAVRNKTEDAAFFGEPRCFVYKNFGTRSSGTELTTALVGKYLDYELFYRKRLGEWMRDHQRDDRNAFLASKCFADHAPSFKMLDFLIGEEDFKEVLGRASRVETYIIPLDEAKLATKDDFNEQDFQKVQQIVASTCKKEQISIPADNRQFSQLGDKAQVLYAFKQNWPERYKQWIYQRILKTSFSETISVGPLQAMYLIVRINRLQMRGQALTTAVSSLLSVVNAAVKSGGNSWVSPTHVLHQDQFLVQKTMAEAASVFKEIVEHKGSVQELKASLALLEYLLANAVPVARGNAAITEWIVLSIALYKGYRLFYPAKQCMNLEALIKPFPEFMQEYTTGVVLEKIEEEAQASAAAAGP